MEYLPLGDLSQYLRRNGPLKENDCKSVIFQVLLALGFMHGQEYTHRDIAPKVHLSYISPFTKLCDFYLLWVTLYQYACSITVLSLC